MIHELMGATQQFMDDENNRIYRRIFAGVKWSGIGRGAIVVIGESHQRNAIIDDHEYWIIRDYESESSAAIMDRCQEYVGLIKVQRFFGDTGNKPMMKEMRNRRVGFRLSPAPFIDEPDIHETYLTVIREKTFADRKALFFGEKSSLPELLRSLGDIPSAKSFGSTYPRILALGYALSAFVAHPYPKPRPYVPSFGVLDEVVGY